MNTSQRSKKLVLNLQTVRSLQSFEPNSVVGGLPPHAIPKQQLVPEAKRWCPLSEPASCLPGAAAVGNGAGVHNANAFGGESSLS